MMRRLTGRDSGCPCMLKCFENGGCADMGTLKCNSCEHDIAIFEKLAHYEDLEEVRLERREMHGFSGINKICKRGK